ncbi:N-acetyl-gamma-glutamyl-phosphate reductase [Thermodesulforhabdus norvegica]|uniref:N-acetyl-gamma-glutamyl-phosphate reductase n=1 Tax=Thermodesulforhabdus norvegica TaxID=39841 RepID=A0A1I4QGX7_9BACT|nr:N-acetyl-gamma-glutamyl-phosphate reductase [Thermodesulforhabdus norvegica]SFM39016.1 N-acetyl-gamma-glutamyl-phosphate reductase [Thermodesulforhabdus norvegica]
MLKVGVLGGSGYTGFELIRLLATHPEVKIVAVSSRAQEESAVSEHYPAFRKFVDLRYVLPDDPVFEKGVDVVFSALPHGASMKAVSGLVEKGVRVIDLSADFRIRDAAVYEQWYEPHTSPDLLKDAVYGLPELYRREIASARLVANPGCYPTSIILALAPLLKNRLIEEDSIIIDSKSGVTGAGRGLSLTTHFCEVNEGFKAYKVGGVHRHIPEIEQELSLISGKEIRVTFTPHLVPMSRGILSTLYVVPREGVKAGEIDEAYRTMYADEPFVRLVGSGEMPSTLQVRGSNFCDIGWKLDGRSGRLIVVSAIDNLTRGASGQAVCNMNIMFGIPETTGLFYVPWQP